MDPLIKLELVGPGFILYSPAAVSHIEEGEDYFTTNYSSQSQVLEHAYNGGLVGVSTSSPGVFWLHVREGYPKEAVLEKSQFKLRLGIKVDLETVRIKDLYELMEWTSYCDESQRIKLANGYYHITMHGELPPSGRLGDDQEIYVYFHKLNEMPKLRYNGVPTLCD